MQTAEDSISHQWGPLLCTLSAAMHNFCNRVQCHRWTWTGEEQTCTLEHLEVHWSNCCKAMEWSATARHERSIRLPGWVDCSAAAVSPDTQQQVPLASLATPPDDLGSVWTMKTDGSQAIHLFVNPSNATLPGTGAQPQNMLPLFYIPSLPEMQPEKTSIQLIADSSIYR